MKSVLLDQIKSLVEFHVIAGGIWLIAVAASIVFLRVTNLHRFRKITISLPAILALTFAALGVINLASLRQWGQFELAYYVLAPPILASLFVIGYFEKRL